MLGATLAGRSGNSGQLPASAAKAFILRPCAPSSVTENPSGVLNSLTVFEPRRKAFGSLKACELPDLNTFAVTVFIRIYREYIPPKVKGTLTAS